MSFGWLKRLMPRGLYGRAALILILPIITIQIVVSVMFLQRHFEGVTRQMTQGVVKELSFVLDEMARVPVTEAPALGAALATRLGLTMTQPADALPTGDARLWYDFSGRAMIGVLRAGVSGVQAVDLMDRRRARVQLLAAPGLVEFSVPRSRVTASNPHQLVVIMASTSLLMTLVAFLFLRNQLRPIKQMAAAAEAFGKGRHLVYRPAGAIEVRAAGAAFLDMRARIERQIEQRTLFLSGVSHDLRTPLTRLRLGLSMLPEDPEVAAMERDVTEMQEMLEAFLAFARGDFEEGEAQLTDPVALVTQVVEDAGRAGHDVRLHAVTGAGETLLRPAALRRALENLVGNAVRYGKRAEVSVVISPRAVRFVIEDDGPGIPREAREEALKPFTRLDKSRNQNAGQGVGLGLSIAADVARAHGGALTLGDSERLGGLRAEIVIAR